MVNASMIQPVPPQPTGLPTDAQSTAANAAPISWRSRRPQPGGVQVVGRSCSERTPVAGVETDLTRRNDRAPIA